MFLIRYLNSLISLVFPKTCGGCGGYLVEGEKEVCLKCLCELGVTGFHKEQDNDAERLFWGKVNVEHATAYCKFVKGGTAQKMLHNLKYGGRRELGYQMGVIMGGEIIGSPVADVDCIVPVPLHPSKLRKRGYNQAEMIAQGISSRLGVPVEGASLVRTRKNETQTHKNINERYLNSQGLFAITPESQKLAGKHILLVDDVITTGATLEACARELLKIEGVKVNCIAFAIA